MERPAFTFGFEADAVCGISSSFPELSPTAGQIAHVLLTRSPLYSVPKDLSRTTCMC